MIGRPERVPKLEPPTLDESPLVSRIIAVANQKGGVGKTTTAVNVAAYLAAEGPTLLIDMDPQGNATLHFGVNPDELEDSLYDILVSDRGLEEVKLDTEIEGLDLIPSDLNLSAAEIELTSVIGRESVLKDKIAGLETTYTFIVLDVPPSLGLLCLNALHAAGEVVVPVQTQFFSLKGLGQLLKIVDLVKTKLRHDLEVRYLATMVDKRTNMSMVALEKLQTLFADRLFDTLIHVGTKLSESPVHGQPISQYSPRSRAALEYRALAREIIEMGPMETPT